ncbi:hypothetical protein Tco_0477792, partial [Tanacetum coccineum]
LRPRIINIPLLPRFRGVIDWHQSQGYREPVIMSSATSAVTYTSVYTNSEPGRAFWGADDPEDPQNTPVPQDEDEREPMFVQAHDPDYVPEPIYPEYILFDGVTDWYQSQGYREPGADDEEISEGGFPRVIVLGYDRLPMQPVAPPSPEYIPGPEDPQIPPVPQDEDKREPMFVQAHDPDYVPEPIYPKYISLEDDHEFLAEEQPLPHVDSPTAESPGYVTESDPEEDPEEYEDDEI